MCILWTKIGQKPRSILQLSQGTWPLVFVARAKVSYIKVKAGTSHRKRVNSNIHQFMFNALPFRYRCSTLMDGNNYVLFCIGLFVGMYIVHLSLIHRHNHILTYSCNNITTTLIQISRLFYFGFFSKTNHQMIM